MISTGTCGRIKKLYARRIYIQEKNSKYEILNHLYFGPNFVFRRTASARFSQCFFSNFLSSVNHSGENFYSALPPPPPSTIKKLTTALVGKNNDDILPSPAALSIGYIREGKSILRKLD